MNRDSSAPGRRGRGRAAGTTRERAGGTERGQTTIDFAIGAGIFLLAVAFVISFVPGMFQPFDGGQERPLAADRGANRLSTDLLGDPGQPYVLNRTCTEAFFDGTVLAGCRYSTTDPTAALGLGDQGGLNVTVENGTDVVTLDGSRLETGDRLSSATEGVVVSQRSVLLDGRTYRLYVRVW